MERDNEFYRAVLDNLADGVYFLDVDRRITYWNRGAERITGYTAPEVLGRRCADQLLMHMDAAGTCLCDSTCPAMDSIANDQFREADIFLRHKNGYRLPVHVKTMPLHDNAGLIVGAIEVFNEMTQAAALRERIDHLERLSLLDPLTDLANRRFLERELVAGLDASRRYGWPLGVIVADIDDFKRVNDQRGHEVGDRALRMVAENLRRNSRVFDVPGRWGGDEFMVISQNVDAANHRRIAERYRSLVAGSAVPDAGDETRVTLSLGATLTRPDDSIASLVDRADRLMYLSKQRGKNRVSVDAEVAEASPAA